MVAEIWASVISLFVDQLVALNVLNKNEKNYNSYPTLNLECFFTIHI